MNGDDSEPARASGSPAPPSTAPDDVGLPYRKWSAVFAGAAVGVVIRVAFGLGLSPMDGAFVLLVPAVIAAVTSVLDERRGRVGLGVHVFHGALANLLFVAGTLAILIEGWICAIVVLPLMMAIGAATGLVVGLLCRVGRFPRQAAFGLVALPFALAAIEERLPPPDLHETVERRVAIAAPPERVWQAIHQARDIRPEEIGHGLAYRIGVPTPIAGVTESTPEGRVRRVTMGKGIRFDQVVVEWEESRRVRFVYRFDEDSVPKGALDDHVRIGGRHFDLIDTEYALQQRPDGGTELAIRIRYRVSTGFNAYAGMVGRVLLGNFGETVLDFYRVRAEAPGVSPNLRNALGLVALSLAVNAIGWRLNAFAWRPGVEAKPPSSPAGPIAPPQPVANRQAVEAAEAGQVESGRASRPVLHNASGALQGAQGR